MPSPNKRKDNKMLRKGIMKRLSKSATDLSGCKRKSHSTSPDEEKEIDFGHAHDLTDGLEAGLEADEDEDEEDEDDQRPKSALSSTSVPAYPRQKTRQGFLGMLRQRLTSRSASRDTAGSSR